MENKSKNKTSIKEKIAELREDRSNLYKILCIVLLVILIVTLGSCGLTMYSRNLAYQAYKDLADQVNQIPDSNDSIEEEAGNMQSSTEMLETESEEGTEETEEEEQEEEVLTEETLIEQLGLTVPKKNFDWEEIHKINPDIYAWIYIPNTEVEYPILQHPTDDDYYLNRNMDGSFGKPGCIFTQSLNHKDFLDLNTVVYGHNMKSGRMFQSVHDFENREFFDRNRYIYVYTEERVLIFEIFASYMTDDSHILNTNDFTTAEGYARYLEKVKLESQMGNFREDVNVNAMNRILTLSTCGTRSSQRYLVQGVLLNDPILYGLLSADN